MLKSLAKNIEAPGSIRWMRGVSTLGVILSLVISALAATWLASRPMIGTITAFAAFAGLVLLGMIVAQLFYELDGWMEQRGRDLRARTIYDAVMAGEHTDPFVLYLRPFASTDQIATEDLRAIAVRNDPSGPVSHVIGTERFEFEAELERALRPIGPLVALGHPMEHLGAGRIPATDDDWTQAIAPLMDAACLIVLLPSPRPGTSWEVERILTSGALYRTIVVDPPDDHENDDSAYDPAQEWVHIRDSFLERGYVLPEDMPNGALMWFGDEPTPQLTAAISLGSRGSIRRFAREIIAAGQVGMPQPIHSS